MGFMKHRTGLLEDGQESESHEATLELVDGTFPTINTRITKSHSSLSARSEQEDEEEEDFHDTRSEQDNQRMSRKQRQEAFEARTDVPETEYIQINEAEWEDFIEFKPGMPKLIEKLHSPKRMGHFGNRPSKKTSKIFSNNDGW
jgi:ATP-dependent RNA helicase MSS116